MAAPIFRRAGDAEGARAIHLARAGKIKVWLAASVRDLIDRAHAAGAEHTNDLIFAGDDVAFLREVLIEHSVTTC